MCSCCYNVYWSFFYSASRKWNSYENYRSYTVNCALAKARTPPSPASDAFIREPHKYFDEVVITVRAGDGGHGAVLNMPNIKAPSKSQGKFDREKTKRKPSYKRDFDGSLILPMGGHGGDVVIYADESKDTLLEFHNKSKHKAKRGGNVDAMGVLTSYLQNGLAAPTLRIPVPLGLFFLWLFSSLIALTHMGNSNDNLDLWMVTLRLCIDIIYFLYLDTSFGAV